MAVTKAKKIEAVEKLSQDLQGASHAIVGTFTKLTVEKDYELRKAVRSAGASYRVVKNTLAERAAKGTKVEDAIKDLAGVTSIAYTSGDPVALAKALSKYAKDNPESVSYTHLRAHETDSYLVCRLLLVTKKTVGRRYTRR